MVGNDFKIVFSKKSKTQILSIYRYYAQIASPEVGIKIRKKIIEESKKLKILPNSKPLLPNIEKLNFQVRYTKVFSFRIIFRVLEQRNQVNIITIRHDKTSDDDILKDLIY